MNEIKSSPPAASSSASDKGSKTWIAWLAHLLLALLLAYAAAVLILQSLDLRHVHNSLAYVASLGEHPLRAWSLSFALILWGLALQWMAARQRRAWSLVPLVDSSPVLTALLFALALTPFWTRIAPHILLPAGAWLLLFVLLLSLSPCLQGCQAFYRRLDSVLQKAWFPFVVAGLASAWFFTVSYYRHHQFGSGSRDMGLFFQSVWLLSQGHAPLNTLIDIQTGQHAVSAFADHLEFIDLLMVPFVWIWRDAGALLLAQALIAGSGVAALMRISLRRSKDGLGALLLGAAYFVSLPIGQALQFDWNPTTLALGCLLWAFDFADQRRYRPMLVALLLVALCKENLLLYVAAFGLYLAVEGHDLRLAAGLTGLSGLLFIVELKLIFPIFRAQGFRHFSFH